jgi:Multiubiquitin
MSADVEEAKAEHHRDIEIVVNAELHVVHQHRLTFEGVVRLAFADASFSDDIVYTVTYKRGPHQNREGSLVAGDAAFITNGMIFNAKRTDKS